MRITLDAETFKALASTTRLAVLRALDVRRKTLSELSRDLALNKATVHEHLQLLSAAELVKKRDDEGRKWIYYELTWRGQKILHPQETTTFNVLLGLSILAVGGGAAMLVRALFFAQEQAALSSPPTSENVPLAAPAAAEDAPSGSAFASSSASPAAGAPSGTNAPVEKGTDANASSSPAQDSSGLLDHDGGLALAILAAGALFGVLSFLLRFRLRPKRPEAPGLP